MKSLSSSLIVSLLHNDLRSEGEHLRWPSLFHTRSLLGSSVKIWKRWVSTRSSWRNGAMTISFGQSAPGFRENFQRTRDFFRKSGKRFWDMTIRIKRFRPVYTLRSQKSLG